MKILFLTPSIRPLGARRSLMELASNLPPGQEPHFILPSKEGIYHEIREKNFPHAIAPQGAWRKVGGRVRAEIIQIPTIRKQIEKWKIDVIHANEFHIVPQAVRASRGRPPVTGHVRLTITPRQIQNYLMERLTRVVVVSENVKSLFANSPIHDRVRVIYNGVNIGHLTHPTSDARLPIDFPESSNENPITVGLFGLISERKNQLLAAEAIAQANAKGGNFRLLLAGDAFKSSVTYGEKLRHRLDLPDLKNRAIWIPFQENIAALYRAINLNLLISKEEGFGRTIIEAGALAKPSIGTRVGGIPELIQHDKTGLLVEEGRVEELTEALLTYHQNRQLLETHGQAAKTRVEENFTIQSHVKAMISLWEEALSDHQN